MLLDIGMHFEEEFFLLTQRYWSCIFRHVNPNPLAVQFEGTEIALDSRVGIFITMNPGYAGRTELPESVKALFRPVVVIVPDLQQICEIMLFSEGFLLAKVQEHHVYFALIPFPQEVAETPEIVLFCNRS